MATWRWLLGRNTGPSPAEAGSWEGSPGSLVIEFLGSRTVPKPLPSSGPVPRPEARGLTETQALASAAHGLMVETDLCKAITTIRSWGRGFQDGSLDALLSGPSFTFS